MIKARLNLSRVEGRGDVVVSALDFRSEDRWFEAQSLPLCYTIQYNKFIQDVEKK